MHGRSLFNETTQNGILKINKRTYLYMSPLYARTARYAQTGSEVVIDDWNHNTCTVLTMNGELFMHSV